MSRTSAYAAREIAGLLGPFEIDRREPGPHDIQIEILFCGVCHSDIHQVRNDWGGAVYPMVPGHEIVGRVTHTGSAVQKFQIGDQAGVGCMVDSCRECESCRAGDEHYCDRNQTVFTYNSRDKQGVNTYGGYSTRIVVDESFAVRVPPGLDLAATAPLLCAGITTYSPMKHWGVGKGQRIGVVGLGGLGHMALKFGRAFGAHVTLFTTSPGKEPEARRLGADEVIVTTEPKALKKLAGSLHFILDTVSAPHDVNSYLPVLRREGAMVLVGLPDRPSAIASGALAYRRRTLAGSIIGGIRETQEMLDYCAEQGIVSDIETIPIQKINEAFERVLKNDVRFRFVIDMASLAL